MTVYQISDNNTRRELMCYYVLELGVNVEIPERGIERICAVEVGPFARMLQAKEFAFAAKGKYVGELLATYPQLVYPFDMTKERINETSYIVAGCTFTISNDKYGTISAFDLY